MNNYYEVKGLASEGTQHEIVREREGIETIKIRIDRKINIWADLVSLFKLYRLFRREKPFIVHSITPKAGLLSMMAAYLAGVPHRLHTFTGLIFPTSSGMMKQLLIFFDKIICFCATRIYPEGKGVKNDLINYRITDKPLKVIANGNINGIDLSYFDPTLFDQKQQTEIRKEWGIETSDFVFCFIGRIVFDKGISEMVSAFVEVAKTNKHIKLLLVGPHENRSDPLPEAIENEISRNPNIILAGWQQDVRPFFAITNVFVFPSYREGFPNVLLQAGAMGKFSIVTNISGSNEIVQDGVNGTVIPVKDIMALTEAMLYVLDHKSEHISPDPRYRALISDKYEQKIVWEALLKEYRELENQSKKMG